MRRRADTTSSLQAPRSIPTPKFVPISVYSHVSTYRSTKLELQLYSPSLKVHEDGRGGPMAVFSDHDQVGGKVTVDPSAYHSGRLTIMLEGALVCGAASGLERFPAFQQEGKHKHVFLSSTKTISLSNSEHSPSRSVFRDAFIRRRPSIKSLNVAAPSSERSHAFTFQLPRGVRPGEEMPATFASSSIDDDWEVSYRIKIDWEPNDPYETPSHLEVPFLLQPDSDFQCVDASLKPESWLEMPLKSDRPIPVRCAITLPTFVTFSRSSSIPFFVVFTTTPRSPELAKEIASDATVSVALVRQISVTEQVSLPPTPPLTPTSEDVDSAFRPKILRRVAKSQPRLRRQRGTSESSITISRNKPLPQIPPFKSFSDTKILHSNMSIGFPKRPRQHCDSQSHPSLEAIASLPDGLYKAKIALDKDMFPSIDWAGVSVKYYLDVSVLLGPDDFRARIPLRIL